MTVDMLERLITDVRRAGEKIPSGSQYGSYVAKAHLIISHAVGDLTALQWEAEHVSREPVSRRTNGQAVRGERSEG